MKGGIITVTTVRMDDVLGMEAELGRGEVALFQILRTQPIEGLVPRSAMKRFLSAV